MDLECPTMYVSLHLFVHCIVARYLKSRTVHTSYIRHVGGNSTPRRGPLGNRSRGVRIHVVSMAEDGKHFRCCSR